MPAPSANATPANRFETMEDLVAIGLLDQKTLDDAKAKAGVTPTKPPVSGSNTGPKSSQSLKSLVRGKPAPKSDPNLGVGPGKTVMSSKDRVNALNHGATMNYEGGKYVGRSLTSHHVAKAPTMRPGAIDNGTGKNTAVAGVPAKGNPTRAGGKPIQKAAVPQPSIAYGDMSRAARFNQA